MVHQTFSQNSTYTSDYALQKTNEELFTTELDITATKEYLLILNITGDVLLR